MILQQNTLLAPQSTVITVSLEPVYNILNSISAFGAIESNPGLDDWVLKTAARLPADLLQTLEVMCYGFGTETLCNLAEPGPATASFPAYLDVVTAIDAVELRDFILHHLFSRYGAAVHVDFTKPEPLDHTRVLDDRDYLLDYVRRATADKEIKDFGLVETAHDLLVDPARLKSTLLDFLSVMWRDVMQAEWERARPILQESVDALSQIETTDLPLFEAIRLITGRNLRSVLSESELLKFAHIQFIPSRHNGPYITTLGAPNSLRIVFGARIPAELKRGTSPLDNVELLNRLKAMGDETRLDILVALRQHGELSTGQIMDAFDLNKSAASRHLRSLHASGLISERRDVDGKGKFYSLSDEGLAEMLGTIQSLLG